MLGHQVPHEDTMLFEIRKRRQMLREGFTLPTPEEQVDEEANFKKSVTELVDFDEFKIYEDQNVEWGGTLTQFNINFRMNLSPNGGLLVTCNLMPLDDASTEVLQKLKTYHDGWKTSWQAKIT